ncbi:hypothetical protein [Sphingomonas dokdonensis]|nr:hypothetical protein [Sphingomonas dokdonensis]
MKERLDQAVARDWPVDWTLRRAISFSVSVRKITRLRGTPNAERSHAAP